MKNSLLTSIPPAEDLYAALLKKIRVAYPEGCGSPLAVAGIYSGGAWVAQRLANDLGLGEAGLINVALHRDDYASKGLHGTAPASVLSFGVTGRDILLVDDVLYTGRTVRAAINEIFDFGRPTRIILAVLVNRIENGVRELPYTADFSGIDLALPSNQILALQQHNNQLAFTLESRHD